MRRLATTAAALVVLVTLAGCGGSGGPDLSAGNRRTLLSRVDAVRSALQTYAPDAARVELTSLRADVSRLQRRDQISDEQAADILSAAAALEADLSLAPTTTTTLPSEPQHGKEKEPKEHGGKGEGG